MKKSFLKILFFAFVAMSAMQVYSQTTITYQTILRSNAQQDTLYDGIIVPIFGITSMLSQPASLPAKTLYCSVGDSVVLFARSISQGEHHTIHLHGLDVDTRNDGDPSTSFWLEHMQDTTYSFKANYAGTYIYHCHVSDVVHVEMGMYGLVIVNANNGTNFTAWQGGPVYHSYRNWLMSELDTSWNFNVPVHDTIADTMNIPEYNPSHFLINGKGGSQLNTDDSIKITGAENEIIYLRTANIGFNTNRIIIPSWLNAEIIDSDGRPLPSAIINDTVYVMPGERFGVFLKPLSQATDTIYVEYIDMNTGQILNTWPVPVTISGYYGVSEIDKNQNNFILFPNPTSGEFTVTNKEKLHVQKIEIYNSAGKLVFSQRVNSNSEQIYIPFHRTSNDVYEVRIIHSNGKQVIKKLVVNK